MYSYKDIFRFGFLIEKLKKLCSNEKIDKNILLVNLINKLCVNANSGADGIYSFFYDFNSRKVGYIYNTTTKTLKPTLTEQQQKDEEMRILKENPNYYEKQGKKNIYVQIPNYKANDITFTNETICSTSKGGSNNKYYYNKYMKYKNKCNKMLSIN
jgi:hypothetical protein